MREPWHHTSLWSQAITFPAQSAPRNDIRICAVIVENENANETPIRRQLAPPMPRPYMPRNRAINPRTTPHRCDMQHPPPHPEALLVTAIRSPAVAGTFYPADPARLHQQIAGFLAEADNAPPTGTVPPKAIIGPHAGYEYSGAIAARAYARLAAARGTINRVVLIGPSHYVGFQGLAVDTAEAWALPGGTVPLDTQAIAALRRLPQVGALEAAYTREHALEVHVPFLQQVLGDFRLVPIVAGNAPPAAVAAVLEALWGGPETLIVVSTDLSHYLDYAACQQMDSNTAAAIERFDIDAITTDGACGAVPTRGLLLAAHRRGMTIERLDLRNSGDTAGTHDRVVGYGAWALHAADDQADAPVGGSRASGGGGSGRRADPACAHRDRHRLRYGPAAGRQSRRPDPRLAFCARRGLRYPQAQRDAARLHRLGGGDAATDRGPGDARLQRRVP